MRNFKILIAPDKFKGTLTATQAARAIERGLRAYAQSAGACEKLSIRLQPIADGGEGTLEAVCAAIPSAAQATTIAVSPLGKPLVATLAQADETAFFEMACVAGLRNVPREKQNPWRLNTHGIGAVIRAIASGDYHYLFPERVAETGTLPSIKRCCIGLGGSATNDAGLGMASALGYRFLDQRGQDVEPHPENFERITHIARPEPKNDILHQSGLEIIGMCDVTNPLLGPQGASFVYGPQKRLRDPDRMDATLTCIADVITRDLGTDFRNTPGAGAAGGLGYGLMTFCCAKLQSGFDTVANLADLKSAVRECEIVITGEGKLDAQTLYGKGPAALAQLAKEAGKPIIAFCGITETGDTTAGLLRERFAAIHVIKGPQSNGSGAEAALEATAKLAAEKILNT